MRAAGRSATVPKSCMNRCGASGWSAGDASRAKSRPLEYGRSSSRAARDDPKRCGARAERRRKPIIRSAASNSCTTSGRGSRSTYARVPLAYERISSGMCGSSRRSSAPKPLCQSGGRLGTKRFARSATDAARSLSSMASTASRRSANRSLSTRTRARQAVRLAAAPSNASSDAWTRRPTKAPAAPVSGRLSVSDQTRRTRAISSSARATRFPSATRVSSQAASGEAVAANWLR